MNTPLRFTAGLALLAAGALSSRATIVVVSSEAKDDVAVEATALAQSTYALAVSDFLRIGFLPAREAPLTPDALAVLLEQTFAEQLGPRVAVDASPDIVLSCHYGEVSPVGPQYPVPRKPGGRVSVSRALLVGAGIPPLFPPSLATDLHAEEREDRFFLLLTAYEGAALRDGREVVRWQTRVSADSLRNDPQTVWWTLAEVAARHLGSDLYRPELVKHESTQAAVPRAHTRVPRVGVVLSPRAAALETAFTE